MCFSATNLDGNGSRWIAAIIFFGCQQAHTSSSQGHDSNWYRGCNIGILYGCLTIGRNGELTFSENRVCNVVWQGELPCYLDPNMEANKIVHVL